MSDTPSVKSENNCPACGEKAERSCRCDMGHQICKNGHNFASCPTHKIQVLVPKDTHSNPKSCYCPSE